MKKLRVLDLFSGIGGFSLGLERTGGFETVAFCEIEPFPRRVLAKHWPEVPCYEDVTKLTGDILERDGITGIDVITGGFPCQDLSVAGRRAGLAGERSGLWSEIVRLAGELRPSYIIVENVANLLSGPSSKRGGWFGRVLGDLAECGYDAEWRNIPACMVGAPHRRERIWVLAHATQVQRDGCDDHAGKRMGVWPLSQLGNGGWSQDVANASGRRRGGPEDGQVELGWRTETVRTGEDVADANGNDGQGQQSRSVDQEERAGLFKRPYGSSLAVIGRQWVTEPDVGRVAHGIPSRVDRLAGLGNAVVPQIPELIGNAILQAEADNA